LQRNFSGLGSLIHIKRNKVSLGVDGCHTSYTYGRRPHGEEIREERSGHDTEAAESGHPPADAKGRGQIDGPGKGEDKLGMARSSVRQRFCFRCPPSMQEKT